MLLPLPLVCINEPQQAHQLEIGRVGHLQCTARHFVIFGLGMKGMPNFPINLSKTVIFDKMNLYHAIGAHGVCACVCVCQ